MRHLLGIVALAACLLAVPTIAALVPSGCATMRPVVDTISKFDVEKYAQNALLTVGVLESISRTLDLGDAKQKDLDALFARVKVSIDAAERACEGIAELNRAEVDQAFANFKGLYNDVLALLGPYGVHRATSGTRSAAAPGQFVIADPIVFGV